MRRIGTRMVVAAALVAGLLVGAGAPPAGAAPSSGINDWSCRPSAAHPEPVVMLHGLGAPPAVNWALMGPAVAGNGYCVFTPTYGVGPLGLPGSASMRSGAADVAAFVDRVRATTGASKVSLVGHSEGTTVSAYYLKFLGGASKVRHFVGFGANYAGTSLYGLNLLVRTIPGLDSGVLDPLCGACNEYLPPSSFLTDLAAGGITVPGPTYTTIVSRYDTVVVPYTSGLIREPGVTNIVLQDRCWLDFSGHLTQAVDPNVTSRVLWALGGKAGREPGCVPFFAPI